MKSLREAKPDLDFHAIASKYTELKEIAPGSYLGLCPLHGEKTPSFRVDTNKGVFYCFGCQKGGDVLTFLHLKENLPYTEMPQYLKHEYGIDLFDKEESSEKVNQLKVLQLFSSLKDKEEPAAVDYMRGRLPNFQGRFDYGLFLLTEEKTRRFLNIVTSDKNYLRAALQLGLVYKSQVNENQYYSPFTGRLIFPLLKYGTPVGMNGRLTDSVTKYKKYLLTRVAEVWHKKSFIYGLDYARKLAQERQISYVYVTEGVMDAIALLEAGIPAVSVLGARVSDEQFSQLMKPFETIYVALDSDTAGITGVRSSIYSAFISGIVISGYLLQLPKGQDVADFIAANAANPDIISKLPKESFENIVINHYIKIAQKSLADANDVTALKKRVLAKISEHLYDYKTNEFSKGIILKMSERMAYKPEYIFSIIDNTLSQAQQKTRYILNATDVETFSQIVDFADSKLLRLVHTYPQLASEIRNKPWYELLNIHTRELMDIIVERDADPKVDVDSLIDRKVRVDKKLKKDYIEALVMLTKLDDGEDWMQLYSHLNKLYTLSMNSRYEQVMLKYVKDSRNKISATTTRLHNEAKRKELEAKKDSNITII